jgi:tetratricopeptide (TPR) repeat protein
LIQKLGQDYPDEPNYRDAQAAATIQWAVRLAGQEHYPEAERLLEEALSTAEQLDREYPDKRTTPHFLVNVGWSLSHLGGVQLATDRASHAEASYRRALAVWLKLAGAHPQAPEEPGYREYARNTHLNLGLIFLGQGQWSEAQECFEHCLSEAERLAREYPKMPGQRGFVGNVLNQLAYCHLGAGRPKEAEETFGRYVKLSEELITEFKDSHDLKWSLAGQLCLFPLARLRNPGRALQLAEEAAGSSYPGGLGLVSYRTGRWHDCIRELTKDAPTLRRDNVSFWFFLAMAHWQNGDKERARQIYDQTVAVMDGARFTLYSDRCIRAEAAEMLGAEKPR